MKESSLPEFGPNYEFEIALRLVTGHPLDLRVLRILMGRPHRYNELGNALHVKSDETLNRSLRRLLDYRLITQFGSFREHVLVRTYQLNPLGVAVLFAVARLEPAQRIEDLVESYLRAKDRAATPA